MHSPFISNNTPEISTIRSIQIKLVHLFLIEDLTSKDKLNDFTQTKINLVWSSHYLSCICFYIISWLADCVLLCQTNTNGMRSILNMKAYASTRLVRLLQCARFHLPKNLDLLTIDDSDMQEDEQPSKYH